MYSTIDPTHYRFDWLSRAGIKDRTDERCPRSINMIQTRVRLEVSSPPYASTIPSIATLTKCTFRHIKNPSFQISISAPQILIEMLVEK